MTLDEVKKLDRNYLIATEIAEILEINPNLIRYQAKDDPTKLGFPVVVAKSRVKIPRIPFIKFMEGELYYYDKNNIVT